MGIIAFHREARAGGVGAVPLTPAAGLFFRRPDSLVVKAAGRDLDCGGRHHYDPAAALGVNAQARVEGLRDALAVLVAADALFTARGIRSEPVAPLAWDRTPPMTLHKKWQ